jgi:membrane dipeptidase
LTDRPMRFFDAHCDTVLKVWARDLDFQTGEGNGHVSFPAMRTAGSCVQVFACFVLSERFPGCERETAEELIDQVREMIAGTEGQMRLVLTASELHEASEDGRIAALIGLEGADSLEGAAERLCHFYELGVRVLIPAWQDNPFSGTAFGTNSPLTIEGERLIGLAEELNIMVDVSHLSDRAFDDVCRMATRPFIASHSNCRALCPSLRNLTDAMIRSLADRGGVMGINLSPSFLVPDIHYQMEGYRRRLRASGIRGEAFQKGMQEKYRILQRPPMDWITRHLQHAQKIGGEDVVGLGGDLDGSSLLPKGIDGIADYPKIVVGLDRAGFTTQQIEKICYKNFTRVFGEVLPRG